MGQRLAEFLAGLGSYEPRQDSYDLVGWSEWSAAEQEEALQALRAAALGGDARALVTLGQLGDRPSLDVVRSQTTHPSPWVRFSAQRALVALGESPAELADVLASGSSLLRFGAVMALAEAEGPEATAGLLGAVLDPDSLVRSQALDGLIERYHLIPFTQNATGQTLLESPLKTLNLQLMADLAPLWQRAAWEVQRLFEAIASGADPEALGLRYQQTGPDDFRAQVRTTLFEEDCPFDVALISPVTGHDRTWAETFLALQLAPHLRNIRAVQALADLNTQWLIPTLAASAVDLPKDDPYAIAVQTALQQLKQQGENS
ncbi:hypothetical protein VB712_12445 [Spirulina sp. CCNP1310]|uniref:HEAT repeat domain-containing protein n=1 Tax=Spirulina sp. CCNP1310 TaxID=3110249 RepID=UPI002B20BBE7|nr:hypothetical protein [Spirulina sp. CCNP1310]MEA5420032.1 hypothetical protein [Spirulina sp. CCNP1310]